MTGGYPGRQVPRWCPAAGADSASRDTLFPSKLVKARIRYALIESSKVDYSTSGLEIVACDGTARVEDVVIRTQA